MNRLLMGGCNITLDYLDGGAWDHDTARGILPILRADFELESEPAMEFRFRFAIQK